MKVYTTRQLAELCGYKNDAVIRKMILDGKLKAKKLGYIWIINKDDIKDNTNLVKRLITCNQDKCQTQEQ